jgi:hypothetical protein
MDSVEIELEILLLKNAISEPVKIVQNQDNENNF